MYTVDLTADLNDEDDTGLVWTFLDEAREPSKITPGALVVAGDGRIEHLRILPGLVEDRQQLVTRALAG